MTTPFRPIGTPWILERTRSEFVIRTRDGIHDPSIATLINPGAGLARGETPAMRAECNGEFICRAVNSHAELIAALVRVATYLEGVPNVSPEDWAFVREAIRNAEGPK